MPQIIQTGFQNTRPYTSPADVGGKIGAALDVYSKKTMEERKLDASEKWKLLDYIEKSTPGGIKGAFQSGTNPYIANLFSEALRSSGMAANIAYTDSEIENMLGATLGGQIKAEELFAMGASGALTDLLARGAGGASSGATAPAGTSSGAGGAASTPSSAIVDPATAATAGGTAPAGEPGAPDMRAPGYPTSLAPLASGVGRDFVPMGAQGLSPGAAIAAGMSPFAMGTDYGTPNSPSAYTPGKPGTSGPPPKSVVDRLVADPTLIEKISKEQGITPEEARAAIESPAGTTKLGRKSSILLGDLPSYTEGGLGIGGATDRATAKGMALYALDKGLYATEFANEDAAKLFIKELASGTPGKLVGGFLANRERVTAGDVAKVGALIKDAGKEVAADLVPAFVGGKWTVRLPGGTGGTAGVPGGTGGFVKGAEAPAPVEPSPVPVTPVIDKKEVPTPPPVTPPEPTDPPAKKAAIFKAFARNMDSIIKAGEATGAGSLSPKSFEAWTKMVKELDNDTLVSLGLGSVVKDRAIGVATDVAKLDLDPKKAEMAAFETWARTEKAKYELAGLKYKMDSLPEYAALERESLLAEVTKKQLDVDIAQAQLEILGMKSTADESAALLKMYEGRYDDDLTKMFKESEDALRSAYKTEVLDKKEGTKVSFEDFVGSKYVRRDPYAVTFVAGAGAPLMGTKPAEGGLFGGGGVLGTGLGVDYKPVSDTSTVTGFAGDGFMSKIVKTRTGMTTPAVGGATGGVTGGTTTVADDPAAASKVTKKFTSGVSEW